MTEQRHAVIVVSPRARNSHISFGTLRDTHSKRSSWMLRRGKVSLSLSLSLPLSLSLSHSDLYSNLPPPPTAGNNNAQRDDNNKGPTDIPSVERMATLGIPVHDGELPVPTFAYSGT